MTLQRCLWVLLAAVSVACSSEKSGNTRFSQLDASYTGVTFHNEINETDSLNLLNYEYIYNGGGVAIIDINNDGLKDLFFTGNQVSNALYLNIGNLQFQDITKSALLFDNNIWSTGVAIVDINLDGFDDIYVSVGGPGDQSIYPNKLYINQQDNTFKEQAEEYGLADSGESIQAAFFDFDLDGDLDMYLLTGGGFERSPLVARPIAMDGSARNTDRLYLNEMNPNLGHPVFKNISNEAGITIEGFGLGVAILDANQDNWPDIYVSNDYISRDVLYINQQNGTFEDQSLNYLGHTSHFSMGNDVADFNNDGLHDLITVDMLPEDPVRRKLMSGAQMYDRYELINARGYGNQQMRNMLQMNTGMERFSEIGQMAGIFQTDWSWAPLAADFDNDGFQDLFITNGYGRDITDLDFVKFRSTSNTPFKSPEEIERLFLDSLYSRPVILLPNYAYRNKDGMSFEDKSADWGLDQKSLSNGTVYSDLDNDGDLDLVVNNINSPALVLQNKSIESDSLSVNFLNVHLSGQKGNPKGLGAQVEVWAEGKKQSRWNMLSRGFQSSVSDPLHFGLGRSEAVDSILVYWSTGVVSKVGFTASNQILNIDYNSASPTASKEVDKTYLTQSDFESIKHDESNSNDFRVQPLLLQGHSKLGPSLAVGDVNGDGMDDLFVGAGYGSNAKILIQKSTGDFTRSLIETESFEDTGALFFDADGDGDLDLYVGSGGSERAAGNEFYQDRLYKNDGTGKFVLDRAAIPAFLNSTSVVTSADYDLDGDEDLFVGCRVTPGRFPESSSSYILTNEGGAFSMKTLDLLTNDLVTSAVWSDYDNDGLVDLLVTTEYGQVKFIQNIGGSFQDRTRELGLDQLAGLWNGILPVDIDQDADMDYIVGNLGLNNSFKASQEKPLEIFYKDFDKNGAVDPVFAFYDHDEVKPIASLDVLISQVPSLKKKYFYYKDFANSTMDELLWAMGSADVASRKASTLASTILVNNGADGFESLALPKKAQVSPLFGLTSEDVNADGIPDLIATGNTSNTEVVYGKYDASLGLVMLGDGVGNFKVVDASRAGIDVKGDGRAMVKIKQGSRWMILASQNDSDIKAYEITRNSQQIMDLHEGEYMALIEFKNNRKQKMEFFGSAGYWSQSSKRILVPEGAVQIIFMNATGQETRRIEV